MDHDKSESGIAQGKVRLPAMPRRTHHRCQGYKLDLGGRSPWLSYPFGLHPNLDLPWSVFVSDDNLVLRSVNCGGSIAETDDECMPCATLGTLDVLVDILERVIQGPHKNIRWQYLTVQNLIDLLHHKNQQINALKLDRLNLERSLLVRARHLEAFKRFLFAVAKGDIPRLHSLVDTMLRDGASIFAILEKIGMASRQVYSPKNYADADYKQLFLFHKLGGRAVAELAHRTQGLPSIDATRRHIRTSPLHASPKMPTTSEMSANLDISYPPTTPSTCRVGFQLMADEIKIESRLRWDSRTNMILGVCREHTVNLSMEFQTISQPDAIIRGINKKECHFASEVKAFIF
jgi:hypothetical protein